MNSAEQILEVFLPYAEKIELNKKVVIIDEGSRSDFVYFVHRGCLRSWFNQDGKDVSFQFFLEGSLIASIDSFMFHEPSPFTVETILPTTLYAIPTKRFSAEIEKSRELKDAAFVLVCHRLRHYQRLFLSRIKDTPQQRYIDLINSHPELVKLIPQHYIASYLGITSVSLSRIRSKVLKQQ